ncbi:MAG TPA: hypothetical protein VFE24_16715 [Pirellulales bacterium]|nr:hypothetical protein [Pirellulales bacterium]
MMRFWFSVVAFCSTTALFAQSPATPVAPGAPAAAKSPVAVAAARRTPTSTARRTQLEDQLQAPANLDFKGQRLVSIAEIFAQLHEKHGLSIRFDVPTLANCYGPYFMSYPRRAAPEHGPVASTAGLLTQPPMDTSTNSAPIAAAAPAAANVARTTASSQAAAASEPARLPVAPPPAAAPAPANPPAAGAGDASREGPVDFLGAIPVDLQTLDLKQVSIATVLRHALDAIPAVGGPDEVSGLPMLLTNASLFDYLVEDDGIVITSRLRALTHKETRVYSLKKLTNLPPEQLSKIICQSIRPWSWRSRIDDLGDKLKAGESGIPPELLGALVKSGIQLASAEFDSGIVAADAPAEKPAEKSVGAANELQQMRMLANGLVNGTVTFAHATLTTLEIFHYGEPPTGSIQCLSGRLIITQSQAAHREIADLLQQLSEEN